MMFIGRAARKLLMLVGSLDWWCGRCRIPVGYPEDSDIPSSTVLILEEPYRQLHRKEVPAANDIDKMPRLLTPALRSPRAMSWESTEIPFNVISWSGILRLHLRHHHRRTRTGRRYIRGMSLYMVIGTCGRIAQKCERTFPAFLAMGLP